MAMLQCKMCGGMLDLPAGITSGECPYCGNLTTFPQQSNERIVHLCSRAEHYRLLNDFERACETYEKILELDDTDPDVHWGLLLSRFGIEYVEDPTTHERIPTCHRIQKQSILLDPDYLATLELSTGSEHDYYEKQAHIIADIQNQFLKISSREQPYDVFICYKETSDAGTRTHDSTLAQDIYYQLTNEHYKVFFARITLEDKLGEQYEPYIFSALQSAKVMLVIGTQKEFFEAVWVRNEWTRFLDLMKEDASKLLIPCYRNMDPYDLPEELSMFQSQDMGKIGFIQDLIHGIKKVIQEAPAKEPESMPAHSAAGPSIDNLLERVRFFLASRDFDNAREYCFRILDSDPKNLEAFFLQLLAELHLTDDQDTPRGEIAPNTLGSYQFIMASSHNEYKQKALDIQQRYERMPIFREALNILRDAFPDLPVEHEEHLENWFDTLSLQQGLAHMAALCQAIERLDKVQDLTITSALRNQCMKKLYQVAGTLDDEQLQTCLLTDKASFDLKYPEIAQALQSIQQALPATEQAPEQQDAQDNDAQDTAQPQPVTWDDQTSEPEQTDLEEALNDTLLSIFKVLDGYQDSSWRKQQFMQRIMELKQQQSRFALMQKNTQLMLDCLDHTYLKRMWEHQNLNATILAECYQLATFYLTRHSWEKALPLLKLLATYNYMNTQSLVTYCDTKIGRVGAILSLMLFIFPLVIFILLVVLSSGC